MKVEGNILDRGRTLRLSRTQALNCYELACIAAQYADEKLGKPRPAHVALTPLADPADHVFCSVGDAAQLNRLDGVKVSDLKATFSSGDDLWAVDPWLNIFCNIVDYGGMVDSKLKKCQAAKSAPLMGNRPARKRLVCARRCLQRRVCQLATHFAARLARYAIRHA